MNCQWSSPATMSGVGEHAVGVGRRPGRGSRLREDDVFVGLERVDDCGGHAGRVGGVVEGTGPAIVRRAGWTSVRPRRLSPRRGRCGRCGRAACPGHAPAPVLRSAVSSTPTLSMSTTARLIPSAAYASAIARPMPLPAPVTTATLPESSSMRSHLYDSRNGRTRSLGRPMMARSPLISTGRCIRRG